MTVFRTYAAGATSQTSNGTTVAFEVSFEPQGEQPEPMVAGAMRGPKMPVSPTRERWLHQDDTIIEDAEFVEFDNRALIHSRQ